MARGSPWFDPNEVQALVTAEIEGEVDNLRVRQICNIHPADATMLLQALVTKDALVRDGHGRWSRYRLSHTGDSLHNEGKSEHNEGKSEHNEGKSEHNAAIQAIAEQVQNRRRLTRDETEQIIMELCDGRWLTKSELAKLLYRNPDGVRQRILIHFVAGARGYKKETPPTR